VTDRAFQDAARLVWPEPATMWVGRSGGVPTRAAAGSGSRRCFVLVPSAADPRLAVPGQPATSRAAAAVARGHSAPASTAAAARSALIGLAFRLRAGGLLLRDRLVVDVPADAEALEDRLAKLLAQPVAVGLRVGPPRANRKPVLPVVSTRGELLAFAKLGANALTDALVRSEADALTRLAGAELGEVVVPRVLLVGDWHGHALLVQAALPVRRSAPVTPSSEQSRRLTQAMLAVAATGGRDAVPLASVPWWTRTLAAAEALPAGPAAFALQAAGRELAAHGTVTLPTGSWHGDWNPGNCSLVPGAVLVWDWERYESGVLAGFDALHLRLQAGIGSGLAPAASVARMLSAATLLLAPFGVPAAQAPLVATLYLWGLGVRYAGDDQDAAGAAVGRLGSWLLPALSGSLTGLPARAAADRKEG
jgi:Phosphotransferase enzyme family